MDTATERPSTTELFDTSPTQEETIKESSPVAEVKEVKEEKATVEESEEKAEVKESESEEVKEASDDTSSDTDVEPSTEESTVEATRLKDAQKWGNEQNRKALELERQLKQLKEEFGVEDTPIDDTEASARLEERIKTSESIERAHLGDEFINKTIYAEDSIWQQVKNDPIIDFRVRNADSPISEALKVVKEQEFHTKYGNDPDGIVSTIKEELKAELMKELKTDFKKKLKDKESLGSDLSDVKSDSAPVKGNANKISSTEDLFG